MLTYYESMKLIDVLLEEKAQIVFPHPVDASRVAYFNVISSPTSLNNVIRFMAASEEDLNKLDGVSREVILESILKYANNQFKEINFVPIKYDDDGAGFGIKIDLQSVVEKLRKY